MVFIGGYVFNILCMLHVDAYANEIFEVLRTSMLINFWHFFLLLCH